MSYGEEMDCRCYHSLMVHTITATKSQLIRPRIVWYLGHDKSQIYSLILRCEGETQYLEVDLKKIHYREKAFWTIERHLSTFKLQRDV